jgi:hypothetical protein
MRSMTPVVGMSLLLAAAACAMIASAQEAPSELPLRDTISQHGITWKLDRRVPVGRFVGGDYYVVGPVTVTGITPRPAEGRNGSMLNMPVNPAKVGFDDRTPHGRYDPELFLAPPIALKPGDALVSSISVGNEVQPGKQEAMLWNRATALSYVRTAAVLTCLPEAVPADAFRPGYCDRAQKVFLARNLRRDLLPRLARVPSTPDLAEWERMFERPWLDTIMDEFGAPIENMPVYGREFTRATSIATLLLSLDFTPQEKETLLVRVVQVGIDLRGLLVAGKPGWGALGGHYNGRKWTIIFAGIMLGDEEMQHPNKTFPDAKFSEDLMTMFDKCWTGAGVVYAGHVGPQGHPRHVGWGRYEHLHPSEWESNIGESYRRCCTSKCWVGEALAICIFQAEKLWDHDAFLAYADRWMTEDDTRFLEIIKAARGSDYNNDWARQGMVWDPFVKEMWAKYRSDLPPVGM